jgi:hypothetical protein
MSASVAGSLNITTNGLALHMHPFVEFDIPKDVLPIKNSKLAAPLQSACPTMNLISVGVSAADTVAGIAPTTNKRRNIASNFFMSPPPVGFICNLTIHNDINIAA